MSAPISSTSSVVLYRRPRSGNWQARYRDSNGQLQRFSTGTDDPEAALAKAEKKLETEKLLTSLGHPSALGKKKVVTFGDICERFADQMRNDRKAGIGRVVHQSYLGILENWLIPYFRAIPISGIDESAIAEFERHRRQEFEREPAKTTINTHNVVLRKVFEFAVQKKLMQRAQIPRLTIRDKGRKAERRPAFSLAEWRELYRFLRRWSGEDCSHWVSSYKRRLLREYVLFLANTGIRPGTEALGLTWAGVQEDYTSKEKAYVRIMLRAGKRGPRTLIARSSVRPFLKRLRALTGRTAPNDRVFCMPDGTRPKDLEGMFARALAEAGLSYDGAGRRRTLYSLRHTYATFRLDKGTDYRRLAKQMGTSVGMIERHYAHDEVERHAAEFDA